MGTHAEPQAEHGWLAQLVGRWSYEHEASLEPGSPPAKLTGTELVRGIGSFWVACEGRGEMPGGGIATTLMTLGYDPARELFVGTFIASMMTHLWIYEGNLDETRRALTLDTEGPSFSAEGGLVRYQDVLTIEDDATRTLRSRVLAPDGSWTEFMHARYRRTG